MCRVRPHTSCESGVACIYEEKLQKSKTSEICGIPLLPDPMVKLLYISCCAQWNMKRSASGPDSGYSEAAEQHAQLKQIVVRTKAIKTNETQKRE